jgi:zinc protease
VVFEEIRSLQQNGPDTEDLNNLKESLHRSRETNLESNSYWLNQLIIRYQKGEDLPGFWGYEESIDALTVGLVAEAARRYYNLENYVQVTLYPESLR